MFVNILAAALRNLMRNRLYAAISIASLAIGMAAALATFLYVRDELTFDHFVPGYRNVFVVRTNAVIDGRGQTHQGFTTPQVAGWMKMDIPEVKTAARSQAAPVALRRAGVETPDTLVWADPDFFKVFPLRAVAGDLQTALHRPDGLVLSRSAARRYFGTDRALGRTLELNRSTALTVAAVIEDLPGATNLDGEIYVSGLSPQSPLYRADHTPYDPTTYAGSFRTYVRLAHPGDAESVEARLPRLIRQRLFPTPQYLNSDFARSLTLTLAPIGTVHMMAESANVPGRKTGSWAELWGLSVVALLVLLAAGVNFVNLSTARAARRSLEVGVRKVTGAGRGQLMLQFLGEALLHSAVAMAFAVMLIELVLPAMNGLFQRRLLFAYWRDPTLVGLTLGLTLLMGALAGLYPALVLSSFRPATALKPGAVRLSGSVVARQGLVVTQFAILIMLTLAVMVISSQTWFAMTRASGLDTEQVLRVSAACRGAFAERLSRLPGVKDMTCSSNFAAGYGEFSNSAQRPDGRPMSIAMAPVDFGFFRFYGVRPLAGRLPSSDHGEDGLRFDAPGGWRNDNFGGRFPPATVVNQAMVHALGLRTPMQAVGQVIRMHPGGDTPANLRIIGVVPDISYDLTRGAVPPTIYPVIEDASQIISLRVRAGRIPETAAAVQTAWREVGEPRPLRMRFMDEFFNTIYANVIRQAWLIGSLAAVAAFIAALGLFGLAAFVAEQRTKEIGVRKALGASTRDVLALLVWSFTRPVLVANLIAWPLGWWALDRWLQGFSQRISLSPWLFLAAGGSALLIAAVTVAGHALRIASAKPVGALRYE